ncbi:amino acid ABC transporter periplasmic amino acid-binding protein [Streptococcus pneumoniae]|nr:amino acid ABC transporter periplasmic amino acid-binding protein [Streptococcus pneumoniae]
MNKMKKVLMTMFGLVMLPLLFACSNNQSAGIEAIKSKGKLVVALNPDFAPFEYQKVVDGKNQIVGSDIELAKAVNDLAQKDLLQNSSLVSLPKNGNLITDLKSGQVDAVIFEEPVAKGFVENNPDLAIADLNFEKEQDDSYAVAMKKDSKELKEAVDKTIQKLKESGELDKLIEDAFKASIEK